MQFLNLDLANALACVLFDLIQPDAHIFKRPADGQTHLRLGFVLYSTHASKTTHFASVTSYTIMIP